MIRRKAQWPVGAASVKTNPRSLLSLMCAGMAVVSITMFCSPANAVTTKTEPYSVFRCIYLAPIATYIQVTATGSISWVPAHNATYEFFSKVTIHNPSLSVSSRTGCARTSGFVTRAKAEVAQGFYARACSANSNIGVSIPWGISVSPTYSCNNTKVASRSTSYGKNNKWIQNNTGAPVHWNESIVKGAIVGQSDPWPCIDMKISVTVYQGTNTSDSVIWGDNDALHALEC